MKPLKLFYVVLASVLGIIFILPILWMFSNSFKTDVEVMSPVFHLLPQEFTWDNFHTIFVGGDVEVPIFRWIFNSFFVGFAATFLVILLDTMAAYALTKLDLPFKKTLIALFVGSLMVPGIISFLPQYLNFSNLNLINTYYVLILPYSGGALGVFLLIQFFQSFPIEIIEAAKMDGANKWHVFTSVLLPSSVSIVTTLAIFTFMGVFNDYVWPFFTVTDLEMRTLTAGIAVMATGSFVQSYGKLMALATLSTLPTLLIFLIGQRQFIQSITATGVKQ
ncbi:MULTISPECIES: carbohydrate ABC transporter permease [Paenibacillus]|uniref:Carbohydrate ABC transporter permease n=1 Tax=Paenibacillus violae TaxID=3077234 RepID=A0ABU3R817_9BACL|nr:MULTISPECIES: carbohydrate ABC transporter permease [Paenibacillus]MDU0200392.1 carbohydrate ABC transporter permease [Paenibacillus sp. PFR10]MEC0265811.1 carbohydrate ABC transporter permease [Paenibacillus anseongense]